MMVESAEYICDLCLGVRNIEPYHLNILFVCLVNLKSGLRDNFQIAIGLGKD